MYLTEAQKQRRANFKARLAREAESRKKRKILEFLEKVKGDPTISPEKRQAIALRVKELLTELEKVS